MATVERATPDVAIGIGRGRRAARAERGPRHVHDPAGERTPGWGGLAGVASPPGLPNAYNVAAAMAAASTVGHAVEGQRARAIEGYPGSFGRLEWIEIQGRRVLINLVKNTVSLAEMVSSPSLAPDAVLLGLNDAPAEAATSLGLGRAGGGVVVDRAWS